MSDWLTFEKMITPVLIQIIFWIAVVLIVLVGIVGLFTAGSFFDVIRSLLTIVLGPIVVRVYCELIIVFFRINDHLREIRDNTAKG